MRHTVMQNVMKLGHDRRTAIQADATETGATVPPIRFPSLCSRSSGFLLIMSSCIMH